MPNYRRNYVAGGTLFLTVVTFQRARFLTKPSNRSLLHTAIEGVMATRPFVLDAMVLLPDHFHCLMTLPDGDSDYSTRMKEIKRAFTISYSEKSSAYSRVSRQQRTVWQPRFWEHTVRDADDFIRCADYIHWNPVKHGLVKRVRDYPWSTFHKFVKLGHYPLDWGSEAAVTDIRGAEWDS